MDTIIEFEYQRLLSDKEYIEEIREIYAEPEVIIKSIAKFNINELMNTHMLDWRF